jgi:SAM-dependent methyltransferase
MNQTEVKGQVRQFYDRIGWHMEGDFYQNARYEDLRPVSAEYIHRCHLRVKRHLKAEGKYLLDAGSGPIQYPEYLLYSQGYRYRVCADISIVALQEARKRIGAHGLFVVADVANLPFKAGVFDGAVTLHTFHHLPHQEQKGAYGEIYRILKPGSQAVVVNGWTVSSLMERLQPLVLLAERLGRMVERLHGRPPAAGRLAGASAGQPQAVVPTGTFIDKLDADGLRADLGGEMDFEIRVWRSVSVRFLRAVVHRGLGGKIFLKLLYRLEERSPHFFGEKGQYPLVVVRKG